MRTFKLAVVFVVTFQNLFCQSLFEQNCKNCHFAPRQLDMFISRYTLKYSSETKIKEAIFKYLKDPKEENSVMPRGFLARFGVKNRSTLDDAILKKSIDQFYDIYNLKKRIK